jgi:hypothetical protein
LILIKFVVVFIYPYAVGNFISLCQKEKQYPKYWRFSLIL